MPNDTTPVVDTPMLDQDAARPVTLEVKVPVPPPELTQNDNRTQ